MQRAIIVFVPRPLFFLICFTLHHYFTISSFSNHFKTLQTLLLLTGHEICSNTLYGLSASLFFCFRRMLSANYLPSALSLFSLADKVAVVTGGTGVLGSEMVRGLSAAGATVCILGRRSEVCDCLAEEIVASGGKHWRARAMYQRPSLEDTAKEIKSKFGKIDILVNAAGGNVAEATIQPSSRLDKPIEVRKVVGLNLNIMIYHQWCLV